MEQSVKSLEILSLANDELSEQLNELEDKFQIQFNDNIRINSENTSLKKEKQNLNKQIGTLESNHKEALKLSYEHAQDTEQYFAKQIDAWKIQAENSQSILVVKEKEWKKSIQKNIHQISNLKKTIDDNKKTLQHNTAQANKIESSLNDLLIAQKIKRSKIY